MSVSGVAQLPTWKNKLAYSKSGVPYGHELNVYTALTHAPELKNLVDYNEFADIVQLKRWLPNMPRETDDALFDDMQTAPWTDDHATWLSMWLMEQGFAHLRRTVVQDVVVALAKAATFHPVRDYLERCRGIWDGEPRIDRWLETYLRAKNPPDYLKAVGAKFLIGAVARIESPGCQMDSMLVLEGGQGTGKTSAVRLLGREWSRDVTGDLSTKDAAIHIQSVWIGEMAELSSIRRSDQETIKGFVSRRIDHYRPPYGRNAVDRARHTVFIATTNESEYLQDPTGARRFWPIECGDIDLAELAGDIDQLWGEAITRYRSAERWHLEGIQVSAAALEQSYRQKITPADSLVLEYADVMRKSGTGEIDMRILLREAFDIDTRKDPAKAGGVAGQASRALISHGWVRMKPVGRAEKRRQTYKFVGSMVESAYEAACECVAEKQSQAHKQSQEESAFTDEIPF